MTTYFIEAFRSKEGEFKTNGVKWLNRFDLDKAIERTKEAGLVTICYFRITLKN